MFKIKTTGRPPTKASMKSGLVNCQKQAEPESAAAGSCPRLAHHLAVRFSHELICSLPSCRRHRRVSGFYSSLVGADPAV